MMNKFTTYWSRNWESTSTNYSPEAWLHTHAFETDQQHGVLLPWSYDARALRLHPTLYTRFGKRCFDITVALLVILFILSWLVPLIAVFIVFDSPGPFYFVQRRTGRNGKTFACLKFRTMQHRSSKLAFQQTLKHDDRVTRVGQLLRRTNLDEMLQFIIDA